MVRLGCAEQFPLHVLRAVIGASRWRRTLMLDGLAGDSLRPENGIVAGCFSATYALQAYLVDELRAQATEYPQVGIAVHVDDISQEVVADNADACVDLLVEAARGLKSALHDELQM
eukprot:6118816-Pyramimonas_sp.AAC.1